MLLDEDIDKILNEVFTKTNLNVNEYIIDKNIEQLFFIGLKLQNLFNTMDISKDERSSFLENLFEITQKVHTCFKSNGTKESLKEIQFSRKLSLKLSICFLFMEHLTTKNYNANHVYSRFDHIIPTIVNNTNCFDYRKKGSIGFFDLIHISENYISMNEDCPFHIIANTSK